MGSSTPDEQALIRSLLRELKSSQSELSKMKSELADLHSNVRDLSRTIREGNGDMSVLTKQAVLEAKIMNIEEDIKYSKRMHSDVRELKSDHDKFLSKLILLDSQVAQHDEDIDRTSRITQNSIDIQLADVRADALAKKEMKKERNMQIIKIIFSAIAAVVSFVVGHFLK
jgi:hypothetical protein